MDINPALCDVSGREIYQVGGEESVATYLYKGYHVSLEHFIGRRSTEPMLGIWSSDGAFGICLSSIGKYADPSGGPAEGALQACRDALDTLGKAQLEIEAKALLDVILHFTPALIGMRPRLRQARDLDSLIEVEISDQATGKTVHEASI